MITTSCHCGAVRMELAEAPAMLTDCNCSICHKLGTLWAYYKPEQVKLIAAPGATLAYTWGGKRLEFHTCKTCGCTTHWERADKAGATKMGINARLMEPAAIKGVRIRHIDGVNNWEELATSAFPTYASRSEPK